MRACLRLQAPGLRARSVKIPGCIRQPAPLLCPIIGEPWWGGLYGLPGPLRRSLNPVTRSPTRLRAGRRANPSQRSNSHDTPSQTTSPPLPPQSRTPALSDLALRRAAAGPAQGALLASAADERPSARLSAGPGIRRALPRVPARQPRRPDHFLLARIAGDVDFDAPEPNAATGPVSSTCSNGCWRKASRSWTCSTTSIGSTPTKRRYAK